MLTEEIGDMGRPIVKKAATDCERAKVVRHVETGEEGTLEGFIHVW